MRWINCFLLRTLIAPLAASSLTLRDAPGLSGRARLAT